MINYAEFLRRLAGLVTESIPELLDAADYIEALERRVMELEEMSNGKTN